MKNNLNRSGRFDSGITVEPDIHMLTGRQTGFGSGLVQLILINALIMSSIVTGLSYITTGANVFIIMLETAVLSSLICLPRSKWPAAAAFGTLLLLLIVNYRSIVAGFAVLISKFALLSKSHLYSMESLAEDYLTTSEGNAVTWCLAAYAFILTIILYYSVFIHGNFLITFLATFIMPEIGLYHGKVPSYSAAFVLLTSYLCVFAMQLNDFSANRHGRNNTFTRQRRKEVFYLTGSAYKRSAFAQLTGQLSFITALAVLISFIGIQVSHYERSKELNILRTELTLDFSLRGLNKAIEKIENINGDLNIGFNFNKGNKKPGGVKLSGGATRSGGLSLGNLKNAYDISFNNTKIMEISTDTKPSDSIYLRGYSAGHYTGDKWITGGELMLDPYYSEIAVSSINATYNTIMRFADSSFYNLGRMNISDLTGSGIHFAPYYFSYENADNDINIINGDYATTESSSYVDFFCNALTDDITYELSSYTIDSESFIIPYTFYRLTNFNDSGEDMSEIIENSPLFTGDQPVFTVNQLFNQTLALNYIALYDADLAESFFGIDATNSDYSIKLIDSKDTDAPFSERYSVTASDGVEQITVTFNEFLDFFYNICVKAYSNGIIREEIHTMDIFQAADNAFENYRDVDINIDLNKLSELGLGDIYSQWSENFNNDEIDIFKDFTRYENNCINILESVFRENFTYSLKVEKTPEGEDFIEHFLYDMREGSCSYFASAGVELLRYYGIPARYVEGFVIPYTDIRDFELSDDGYYHYDVYDYCAHAWVEVYKPFIGWVPVEFTVAPGVQNTYITDTTSTPTETTAPTVSTETSAPEIVTTPVPVSESTTATSLSASGTDKQKDELPDWIFDLLVIIGAAAVILTSYILTRSAVIRENKESISRDSENENAVGLYNLILKYLKCIGVYSYANVSDRKHCEILCKMLEERHIPIEPDKLLLAADKAAEARLSGKGFTIEDNALLRELLIEVKKVCGERMSKTQRFKARYIKMLY